jgi:hypothetical protein
MDRLSNGTNEFFSTSDEVRSPENEELAAKIANTDFSIFYGRHCGFHIKGDCRKLAFPLVVLMANFADITEGTYVSRFKRFVNSIFGIRYTLDPDLLGAKVTTKFFKNKRFACFCLTLKYFVRIEGRCSDIWHPFQGLSYYQGASGGLLPGLLQPFRDRRL